MLSRESYEVKCRLSKSGFPRVFLLNGFEAFYYNPKLGLLTLSKVGARLVFEAMPRGIRRVVVDELEFRKHVRGSVLLPIVRSITLDVRYGDEVFVVSEDDFPLAVGKALLGGYEFTTRPKRGEAVKIRRLLYSG